MLTQQLLASSLPDEFELLHVNTSDHRSTANIGHVDVRNAVLALKAGITFAWKLARYRPDLVYVQLARNRLGLMRDLQFLLSARLLRRSVVVHFHSRGFWTFFSEQPLWFRRVVRVGLGRRTTLIVLGETLRRDFGSLIAPESVHVVQNGAFDVGVGLPAGERSPVVVFVGTIMAEKGIFDLLEAVPAIVAVVPDAHFVIAGTWHREAERLTAMRLLVEAGNQHRVTFVGAVTGDVKTDLLRSAAAFVLPSKYPIESQPIAVLDAMSAGTPIVVTRIGTTPEMIDDGVEGFLVDQGDVAGLADSVARLLDDDAARTRMGVAARARYERTFTTHAFASRLATVWREVLAGSDCTRGRQ